MRTPRLCSLALLATAVIHLAVVPQHGREWPVAAVFFVVLSVAELGLAVVVLSRPDRRTLMLGAALSLCSAGLWVVSRTTGLPVGPTALAPEVVGAPDAAATALELIAAALLARLALVPQYVSPPAATSR